MKRLRMQIRGAVQGVGYRPLVYRIARELELCGWVSNDARGLFLEAEGPRRRLELLQARVIDEKPSPAVVRQIDAAWLEPQGFGQFEIRGSRDQGIKQAFILPDIATCPACLSELLAPADRRYRYPFTNCTACGPRFSIIRALPYDRPNTTMRDFAMCALCSREYSTPRDRRFHAQPNACPACGPQLELLGPGGTRVARRSKALEAAAAALAAGQIVALKGLGGFHLLADATDEPATLRLRARKHRWERPLAVMVRDVTAAEELCVLQPGAARILSSPEAPILLLPRRYPSPIAPSVAPANRQLGIMLPYTPLHHLLLRAVPFPLIATSGNLSDEPICTDNCEALQRLSTVADLWLMHNRPIERHVDDSVAVLLLGSVQLQRRARGYAPLPVAVPTLQRSVLAVGGQLKNTVALGHHQDVFISQHIGDLDSAEAVQAQARVVADLLRMYEAQPVLVAHDLHPDYASTHLAHALVAGKSAISGVAVGSVDLSHARLVAVQHHHAHLVACLADNNASGRALGVTWDGSGYGPDGTVWGGEFLDGDAYGYQRVAHLKQFRLPGGEAAVREPRRAALGALYELFGSDLAKRAPRAVRDAFGPGQLQVLLGMLERGVNCPVTSSAGRLFDVVASLLGLRQITSFEGQAAMQLEQLADLADSHAYPIEVCMPNELEAAPWQLDWGPMLAQILADLSSGHAPSAIAGRFHRALAEAIVTVARAHGPGRVALSGGCFQNRFLTELAAAKLRQAGLEVLWHRQVPPGDGGISLGQAVIAAAQG